MANFLLVYKGGSPPPASDEEGQKVMAAWMGWFGAMGDAVVDGGNPISGSKSVASNGAVSDGAASGLTGYSVLKADSLDAAAKLAKGYEDVSPPDHGRIETRRIGCSTALNAYLDFPHVGQALVHLPRAHRGGAPVFCPRAAGG